MYVSLADIQDYRIVLCQYIRQYGGYSRAVSTVDVQ